MDEASGLQIGHTVSDLDGVLAQRGNEEVALGLPQAVQQRAQRGQLRHLVGKMEYSYKDVTVVVSFLYLFTWTSVI